MSLINISSIAARKPTQILNGILKRNKKLVKKYRKFTTSNPVTPVISQYLSNDISRLFKWNIPNKEYAVCVRQLHGRKPKTPELIYVPQIGRWLKNKIRFKILRKTWDPDFSEGAFIYGSTRAVCRITEIIHDDIPDQIDDLLTYSAKLKLMDDMKFRLSKTQKAIIKLHPQDIKILVPLNVDFNKQGDKKNCRVTLRILALKWIEHAKSLKLVLVVLQSEFVRDYTPNASKSEWTISAFDILECGMLTQASTPTG